jgi:hypothetical protein
MGILRASEQVSSPSSSVFIGELSLDGSLRHADGILPMVGVAKEEGFQWVFVIGPGADVNGDRLKWLRGCRSHLQLAVVDGGEEGECSSVPAHKQASPGLLLRSNEGLTQGCRRGYPQRFLYQATHPRWGERK